MQKVLSTLRKADEAYKLINNGDKIAVGISGGKDSLVLLKALANYSKFKDKNFSIVGITINIFENANFSEVEKLCKELGVEYHLIKSDIYNIVFMDRKEKNPCSLCSKLRRGAINTAAINLGCNKVALGHSANDMVHTFFLSLFYEGRISTFAPKTYLDRTGITIIRPLVLTQESDIVKASKRLPIVTSPCPVNKKTQRETIKQLIKTIEKDIPIAYLRTFRAITHPESFNLFKEKIPNRFENFKDTNPN